MDSNQKSFKYEPITHTVGRLARDHIVRRLNTQAGILKHVRTYRLWRFSEILGPVRFFAPDSSFVIIDRSRRPLVHPPLSAA